MARLYGINHSNKDFNREDSWGKNQFNNCFPVALVCYMQKEMIKPVYLCIDDKGNIKKNYIEGDILLGKNLTDEELYYAFEEKYDYYNEFVVGELPRIDVVTKTLLEKKCLKPLEIKLTTLPDNQTCELSEQEYGSEIVVRPDTIVYQAYSIASSLRDNRDDIKKIFSPVYKKIINKHDKSEMISNMGEIIDAINELIKQFSHLQKPLLIQPVWKTEGKSAILAKNCLDAFVWSDFALTKLFIKDKSEIGRVIDRYNRTTIWLFFMLYEFGETGKIDHKKIIDTYTYDTKNDKAFAIQGKKTNKIMSCDELQKPRITKDKIKEIILDNGQKFLSPERRFDAVIQSDVSLFE